MQIIGFIICLTCVVNQEQPPKPDLASLLKVLHDEKVPGEEKYQNIIAIGEFGPQAKAAIPALIKLGKKKGQWWWYLRLQAGIALLRIGEPRAGIEILLQVGKEGLPRPGNEGLFGVLLAHLSWSSDLYDSLKYVTPEAKPAVPLLIQAWKQAPDGQISKNMAMIALIRIGPAAKEAVPLFMQNLESKEEKTRADAAWMLGFIGAGSPEVVVALRKAVQDRCVTVRISAAESLWRLDPGAKEVIPVLIKIVEEYDDPIRRNAVAILGKIGPSAKDAIPLLRQDLKAERIRVRIESASALWRIDEKKSPEILLVLLETTSDESWNEQAWEIIENLGPTAVPVLLPLLKHQNPKIRAAAQTALKKIDPKAAAKAGLPN